MLLAESGQALQTTHPDSDWTIKPYISQCAQMERHSVKSPHTCRFRPACGQLVHATHPLVPPQPPVAPPLRSIEPSADPWNAAWDTEAPDELKQFLLEVLLTPIQASKRSSSSEQHQQNLSLPAPVPELFSKATDPVDRPNSSRTKGVTAAAAEAAAPGSSEPASVSLDTVTDRSVDSNAATSTATFLRAASAQHTDSARAQLQTPSSSRRRRAGSEQTDAQTAPDSLHSQPAIGRPSKKIKLTDRGKAAKPVLSSAEITQAAKDGVVFAKFARFAPWPAQVSRQYDLWPGLLCCSACSSASELLRNQQQTSGCFCGSCAGGQAHLHASCLLSWCGVMLFLSKC